MRIAKLTETALPLLTLALFGSFFFSRSLLVLFSAILLIWGGAAWLMAERRNALDYPLVKPWVAFFIAVALSIILAAPYEWLAPLGKIRYCVMYFPLVFIFVRHPDLIRRLNNLACGVAVLVGSLAMLQYFGVSWTQIKSHELAPVVGAVGRFHARGLMGHHTLFAFPMLLLFQYLFTTFLFARNSQERLWRGAGVLFSALGLFASFSRGSWLAAIVATLFILVVKLGRRAVIPALIVGLVVIGVGASNRGFRDRFTLLKLSQNGDRVALWKSGLRMFRDSPVFGKGFHSYSTYQKQYLTEEEKKLYFWVPEEVHNFYLDLLCGTGLVGLVCFIYLLLTAVRNLRVALGQVAAQSDEAMVVMISLSTGLGGLLNNLTDSHFYSSYGGPAAIFFLAMGQAIFLQNRHKQAEEARSL